MAANIIEIVNALFPIRFPYVALDYEQEVETAKSSSAIKVTYELPNVISSLQGLNFLAVQIFFICLL